MNLNDAIALIEHSSLTRPQETVWADLGCGSGLFTFALANLLQPGSTIYALDKNNIVLSEQSNPHHITIHQQQTDFEKSEIDFVNLDGVLMANSLHYVANKKQLINKLSSCIKDNGIFLIVEYETTKANPWVPYPIKFDLLRELFQSAGFASVIKLGEKPSVYGAEKMYAALIKR
ncbi:methyltransferase family protein [Chitinophaga niastensis]|uniref:Methyltransferase family protein n=1 Tax=Chitinophaga niastensis TaxID=536980 RepID=A0A2P8HDB0_CHINA|nr:class I SAM-dependent methyltransferase [Chitinophaga niastensis]PSL44198.1 methyltransferase family protein [Chitinophaga niastensis]